MTFFQITFGGELRKQAAPKHTRTRTLGQQAPKHIPGRPNPRPPLPPSLPADKGESFYCGDMAGRSGDIDKTDRWASPTSICKLKTRALAQCIKVSSNEGTWAVFRALSHLC